MYDAYRAGRPARGRSRRVRRGLLACLAAPLVAGCSFSLPSLAPDPSETTGSVGRVDVSPLSPELAGEDWRRARGALAIALDPQGSGAAVGWDNPDTRMRGSVTPVGRPYVKSDEICRVFLATVVRPGAESSLQGTACKVGAAEWDIREVRPFRKPE